MTLYPWVIFVHVAGATGLFAALALEGAGVEKPLPAVGGLSMLAVLASGLYLATLRALWDQAWVQPAVPALVAVAIAGALRSKLGAASWRFRFGALAGVLVLMTTKALGPVAFTALGACVAGGLVWALLGRQSGKANAAVNPPATRNR